MNHIIHFLLLQLDLTLPKHPIQEPKAAEKRKLFLENDEAQTQKLNQGHIFIKIGIFHRSFGNFGIFFLVL
jgi:hypothetical protein